MGILILFEVDPENGNAFTREQKAFVNTYHDTGTGKRRWQWRVHVKGNPLDQLFADLLTDKALRFGVGSRHEVAEIIPVGSVDFCEKVLTLQLIEKLGPGLPGVRRDLFRPDFYPDALLRGQRKIVHRYNVEPSTAVSPGTFKDGEIVFIKRADRYKTDEEPRLVDAGLLPWGDYLVSERVEFACEWRCYVTDGVVVEIAEYGEAQLECGWLNIAYFMQMEWPQDYSGAADFGLVGKPGTNRAQVQLVESHDPYACGWYGEAKDDLIYCQWVIDGWRYMLRKAVAT